MTGWLCLYWNLIAVLIHPRDPQPQKNCLFFRHPRFKNANSGKEDQDNDLIFIVKVTAGFLSNKAS